ncbi:MAG TPA: ParB/RepB/Spo0J family partition protein [Epsilonproteobacteria bacterium]|nr:ParB/RepB/Spo0J family partition protein [Campylobacterota bacterium]
MALGRGLGAILEEVNEVYAQNEIIISEGQKNAHLKEIEVSLISPNPYQPRKHFDQEALEELGASIKEHGLLQPIVVIEKNDGYLLVAGERRLRAHKLVDIETIKAIVVQVEIDDVKLRELALIENIQRENLNPIELAKSYSELIEVHQITHDELSNIVHKSRSQITNTLRLLSLIPQVQEGVVDGKITQGHAKILVGLDAKKQKIAFDTIVGRKLNVRETEAMVSRFKNDQATTKETPQKDLQKFSLVSHEKTIKDILPFKYKIKSNRLEIVFANGDEFEKFLQLLQKR